MSQIHPSAGGVGGVALPERVRVGDLWCSRCSADELVHVVDALVRDRQAGPRTIAFLNAHVYCLAHAGEAPLRAFLQSAGVVAVDGVSMGLAAWLLHGERLPRCMMTRAFDAYVASRSAADARAILVGTPGPEVETAAAAINQRSAHLRVVKALSGYLTPDDYRRQFSADPTIDLILMGLGSPRTERLMPSARECCPAAVVWHIGAGTIKCFAGTKRRAPVLVQDCGLEWCHRLVFEPHTWRRYVLGLPRFGWLLVRIWARQRRAAPAVAASDPPHSPNCGPCPARPDGCRASSV